MNNDVRILFADGERAARAGAHTTARACFLEAASCAVEVQLWRAAIRCYRQALELDLFDREPVEAVLGMPPRVISGRGWSDYRAAIEGHAWRSFSVRSAQIVSGDAGAVVECPGAGPVLELIMSDKDLVETRPDTRYRGLPLVPAMIVLRRALWPNPRERASDPATIRVLFAGRERVRLDEHGDHHPIIGDR